TYTFQLQFISYSRRKAKRSLAAFSATPRAGSGSSDDSKGAAGGSTWTQTHGPHSATARGASPLSSRRNSSTPSNSGTPRRRPAGQFVGPAVVAAADPAGAAGRLGQQHRPAVAADVGERPQHPVLAADHQHRLAGHVGGQVRPRRRHLLPAADHLPRPGEDRR